MDVRQPSAAFLLPSTEQRAFEFGILEMSPFLRIGGVQGQGLLQRIDPAASSLGSELSLDGDEDALIL
jgi:hypothetical protein